MDAIHDATTLLLRPRKRSRTDCASRDDFAAASSRSKAVICRWTSDSEGSGADTWVRPYARAAFAWSASFANAAGLVIAISDRLLRSSVTPAVFRPLINCPYVRPFCRAAALMRTTHRRRKSRFLRRRPTNAYFSAVSTDSFAARYSLLLLA